MSSASIKKIFSNNVLRIGINMSNFLLVDKSSTFDEPRGLSPDIGKLLANKIGIDSKFIAYKNPGELADAVNKDEWDVGNFAYESRRAETIDFSNAYVNIDANFLVNPKHKIQNNKQADRENVKIAVVNRSAYDLWLSKNFNMAKLIKVSTIIETHKLFNEGKVHVLAGLKPKLLEEKIKNPNLDLIQEPFTQIKQSIGIKKGNPEIIMFLNDFIRQIINDGTLHKLLQKYNLENKLTIPMNC